MLGGSLALVTGALAGDVLDNAGETILGAGSLGGGGLGLVNEAAGTIAATTGAHDARPRRRRHHHQCRADRGRRGRAEHHRGQPANTGTLAALNASLTAQPGVTDLAAPAGTLTGGTWLASSTTAATTLALGGAVVTDDAADIILSGTAAVFQSGPSATALEQSLLEIAADRDASAARRPHFRRRPAGFRNSGTLMLHNGVLGTSGTAGPGQ